MNYLCWESIPCERVRRINFTFIPENGCHPPVSHILVEKLTMATMIMRLEDSSLFAVLKYTGNSVKFPTPSSHSPSCTFQPPAQPPGPCRCPCPSPRIASHHIAMMSATITSNSLSFGNRIHCRFPSAADVAGGGWWSRALMAKVVVAAAATAEEWYVFCTLQARAPSQPHFSRQRLVWVKSPTPIYNTYAIHTLSALQFRNLNFSIQTICTQ